MTISNRSHEQAVSPRRTGRIPLGLRSVGLKSLWDQRQSLLWWSGGTALMAAIIIMLFPSIGAADELEALFEQMPPVVQAMIGEEFDLSTAAGYLDIRMFASIGPIIFLVYAIGRGNAAIAGEESRGTMDLLLSNPVHRWRIVVESGLAIIAGLTLIGLALWIGLIIGGAILNVEFDIIRAGQASLMSALLGAVFGALTLLIGALTGNSGRSIGITAAVAIATFFLHSLAPLIDWLEPYRILSPFYYSTGHSVMLNGFNAEYAVVMSAIAVGVTVLAVLAFQRRDVQV